MTSPFSPATIPPADLGGTSIPDAATTFPASPETGTLALVTDSLTAPTYSWLFVYDEAISAADKWRFVGGNPARIYVGASEAQSTASYADCATVGPQLATPCPGTYIAEFGCYCSNTAATAQSMSTQFGATAADDTGRGYKETTAWGSIVGSRQGATTAGNLNITAKYKGAGAGTQTFQGRWMHVYPVVVAG